MEKNIFNSFSVKEKTVGSASFIVNMPNAGRLLCSASGDLLPVSGKTSCCFSCQCTNFPLKY